jgi:hypothetical protein
MLAEMSERRCEERIVVRVPLSYPVLDLPWNTQIGVARIFQSRWSVRVHKCVSKQSRRDNGTDLIH